MALDILAQLRVELEQLTKIGSHKEFHPRLKRESGMIEIRGKKVVDFTNWDVFDISRNKQVLLAVHESIEDFGLGASSARLAGGSSHDHIACEARIAQFLGVGSALLFSSKNQAVFSLITSLFGEQDTIFVDEVSQSPVSDSCFLVNANVVSFKNLDTLEKSLERPCGIGKKVIFVDAVSALNGETTNLKAYSSLAQKFGVQLVVDESFALGTVGPRGAGGCDVFGLHEQVLCRIGDLSLGLGCYGAFIAGDPVLITWILQRSRTFNFESAPPPLLARAICKAVDLVELQHSGRERLAEKANQLRRGIRGLGIPATETSHAPVVCLPAGKSRSAHRLAEAFFSRGFLVHVIPCGAALVDSSVLRLVVHSAHTEKHIAEFLQSLAELVKAAAD